MSNFLGFLRRIFGSQDEHSSKRSASSTTPPVFSYFPPPSFSPSSSRTTPPVVSFKSTASPLNAHKPPPDSSVEPSLASAKGLPSSSSQPPTFKQFPHTAPTDATNIETKTSNLLGKGASSTPQDRKGIIKKDIVPQVLKQPLSPSSYKSYFAALLRAEDFYLKKWNDFQLKNVSLELQKASTSKSSNKNINNDQNVKKDDRILVEFQIDSIPEERPFLLSRDLVYALPLGKEVEPFQGLIHRVVKGTRVLVEFGDNFHSQHLSTSKYDISFSFNKICPKKAHQAIEAASDSLCQNFLFPECISRENMLNPPAHTYHELDIDEFSAVHHILSFRGSPPYLLGGPLSVTRPNRSPTEETAALSRTGVVVREAVLEIYKASPEHRILICAPLNSTCDVLTSSLKKVIPETQMFRANAAFREVDGVLTDILGSCHMEGECFACPSRQKLLRFRVVVSTFVSSVRLRNEGIAAGHFSHVFLVDASSVMEPEAMIALSNFADSNTAVVVTGAAGDRPGWVRSNVARKYGLRKSYFERLHERRSYKNRNPEFITTLGDFDEQSIGTFD